MTNLSDTQAIILSAASQRGDGAVLPLPESLKIKGGAVDRRPARARSAPTRPAPREAARSTGSPGERGSAHMHGLLKRPGYRLYPPNSPEAAALLAEQGLGPADLDRALARLERTEGHHAPRHRRNQRGWRVRHAPPGLAARHARRLRRAVHSRALAPGPGAARTGAQGKPRKVPRGRHPAGLTGSAILLQIYAAAAFWSAAAILLARTSQCLTLVSCSSLQQLRSRAGLQRVACRAGLGELSVRWEY
jgi:hypothetical protein